MQIRLTLLVLLLASLACNANVTSLNTPAAPVPTISQTAIDDTIQFAPTPLLDSKPVVLPEAISKINMLDSQNGWMITGTSVLRTQDGGATWHNVTPPGTSALGFGSGASFLDSNRGWILIGAATDPVNQGMLYRTTDGGMTWASYVTPFGSGDLRFLDDTNGWMMLNTGAAPGAMGIKFFQTRDGGANWTQVYTNVPTDAEAGDSLPYSGFKSGFTPISMQEAWVGGLTNAKSVYYLYHTTDGGHTWSLTDYKLPFMGEDLYHTYPPVFFDAQTIVLPVMVGSEGSSTFLLTTHDGGATWTTSQPASGSSQYSIDSVFDFFIWSGNVLLISHDGGQTWTSVAPNVAPNENVLQIQFIDAQTGWAVTSDADGHTSLYKTIDGGQSWLALVQ